MIEMDFEFIGFDEQIKNIEDVEKTIIAIMTPAMNRGAKHAEGEVKVRTPVGATGDSRRSIKSETKPISSGPILIQSRVASSIKGPQMPTLEVGRRAGAAMPPPAALELWVRRVLGFRGDLVNRMAFVVARSISRKGTKGAFMFEEGFKASTQVINSSLRAGLSQLLTALKVK